jgi:hypothetical protein
MGILPCVMHSIDTRIGSRTAAELGRHGTAWEDGYHDTRIRSSRQFRFVLAYIEGNPVERGLAPEVSSWRWSSANPGNRDMLTRPWPWWFEQDE